LNNISNTYLNASQIVRNALKSTEKLKRDIMATTHSTPHVQFIVVSEASRQLYTTLLQSGIEVKAQAGIDIGSFLCNLRGFTNEYLASSVETIFLNGTPVDDLEQPIAGSKPVLAISAAMPGLAGAIFRKNSLHSALRTTTKSLDFDSLNKEAITVTLKLFNSVAKERGVELMSEGVILKAVKVLTFLKRMPNLESHLQATFLNNETIQVPEMMDYLTNCSTVKLFLAESDG